MLKSFWSADMSCISCELFTGDYEDTHNGFVVIHCDDGKVRCTSLESGCAWWVQDIFSDVMEIE